uniref:DUF5720 domain-containing protein n=1 Tax=Steinernema glaseri TaxID=37863 RepID=A0A1I7YFF9_9BILA
MDTTDYAYGGMTDEDYADILDLLEYGMNKKVGKGPRQTLQRKADKYTFKNHRLYLKEPGDGTPKAVVNAGREVELIQQAHLETAHGGREIA